MLNPVCFQYDIKTHIILRNRRYIRPIARLSHTSHDNNVCGTSIELPFGV